MLLLEESNKANISKQFAVAALLMIANGSTSTTQKNANVTNANFG